MGVWWSCPFQAWLSLVAEAGKSNHGHLEGAAGKPGLPGPWNLFLEWQWWRTSTYGWGDAALLGIYWDMMGYDGTWQRRCLVWKKMPHKYATKLETPRWNKATMASFYFKWTQLEVVRGHPGALPGELNSWRKRDAHSLVIGSVLVEGPALGILLHRGLHNLDRPARLCWLDEGCWAEGMSFARAWHDKHLWIGHKFLWPKMLTGEDQAPPTLGFAEHIC